jgi:hypothetical protein
MRGALGLLILGIIFSGFANPSSAEPKRLNEVEIIAFTQGGPYFGNTHDGYSFNFEFYKNGTMDGTSGASSDYGTWEVVNDTRIEKATR